MNRKIAAIVVAGFLIRVFFYLVGARFYYGSDGFVVNGDTYAWIDSILNLIKNGIYTADMEVYNARFYRPPGYGFFIGIFYMLGGNNIENALKIIPWIQLTLDTFAIYLIYKVALRILNKINVALLVATLYASYPFIIVWTPVAVAESISIFFLILSLNFYFSDKPVNKLYAGIFIGISVLTRLQVIFLFPFLAAGVYLYEKNTEKWKKKLIFLLLGFSLTYGIWPIRNYVNHGRLLFAQDLNVGRNWSPDYLAFMDYVFAIQTDHKPQYDQIVTFTEVTWPSASFINPGDSLILRETVNLCRTCGTGFSYFMTHNGTRESIVSKNDNCDSIIALNFNKLTAEQKKLNKFNYYIKVPFSNLYKSLFKFSLYGDKSAVVKIAGSLLFLYRTFLIFAGVAGLLLLYKQRVAKFSFIFIASGFAVAWYLYLSFIYRNMEIRYLLPADLLLLIPACYLFNFIYLKYQRK